MNSRPKNSENTAVTFARKKYGNKRTKLQGPKKKKQTPACIGLRHRKPKCHLNAVGPRKPRRILSKTKKVGDGDGDGDNDDDDDGDDGAGDGNGDDGDGDCDDDDHDDDDDDDDDADAGVGDDYDDDDDDNDDDDDDGEW